MSIPAEELHHWTREEYDQMVETGVFGPGNRVELIEGLIYEMTPQKSRHAAVVSHLSETLTPILSSGYSIRVQMPLALGFDSEPEPDLAVVPGRALDYLESHPTTALLVIEVAESSLHHDRKRKLRVYARAGIPEYWIFNLQDRTIEVFRDPGLDSYRSRILLRRSDTISPLCAPEVVLAVRDLLP